MAAARLVSLVISLALATISCAPEATEPAPLDGASLDRIEEAISSWAQGRGWAWTITRADDGFSANIRIDISPGANDVARSGYCAQLSRDIRAILEPGQETSLELLVGGRVVRRCEQ